jgi:hypothetical protein
MMGHFSNFYPLVLSLQGDGVLLALSDCIPMLPMNGVMTVAFKTYQHTVVQELSLCSDTPCISGTYMRS